MCSDNWIIRLEETHVTQITLSFIVEDFSSSFLWRSALSGLGRFTTLNVRHLANFKKHRRQTTKQTCLAFCWIILLSSCCPPSYCTSLASITFFILEFARTVGHASSPLLASFSLLNAVATHVVIFVCFVRPKTT